MLPWLLLTGLAGCATPVLQCTAPPEPPMAPAAVVVPLTPSLGAMQLHAAQQRFDRGDFSGTISLLQASTDLWADHAAVRSEGYKLLAFSYCVTQRKAACRQAFESLLRVDPEHVLKPTEIGHRMWGPVFRKVRADAGR